MPVKLTCPLSLPLDQLDGTQLEETIVQAGLTLLRQPLSATSRDLRIAWRPLPQALTLLGRPWHHSWPHGGNPTLVADGRAHSTSAPASAPSPSPGAKTAAPPAAARSARWTPCWRVRDRARPPTDWSSWRVWPLPPGPGPRRRPSSGASVEPRSARHGRGRGHTPRGWPTPSRRGTRHRRWPRAGWPGPPRDRSIAWGDPVEVDVEPPARERIVALAGGWGKRREPPGEMEGTEGLLATGRLSTSPMRGELMTRRLVATAAAVEAIGALAHREAARLGGEQAERVVLLGNGAGWIDPVARESVPGSERRVDGWHLLKRTREAVRAATGETAEAAELGRRCGDRR